MTALKSNFFRSIAADTLYFAGISRQIIRIFFSVLSGPRAKRVVKSTALQGLFLD
jgi:hypothetical protein